jgi:hypothetical protein
VPAKGVRWTSRISAFNRAVEDILEVVAGFAKGHVAHSDT